MNKSQDRKMNSCQSGKNCEIVEVDLDKIFAEYAELGAVPHCCFSKLCEKKLVTSLDVDFSAKEIAFYSSPQAFYHEKDSHGQEHIHISLAQMMAGYPDTNAQISFHSFSGSRVQLTKEESVKLLEQAAAKRMVSGEEEIEVEEGQQLIFSSPDPDLPQGFLEYLSRVFSGLDGIAAVYAFETTAQGEKSNLVIALQPEDSSDNSGLEKLSMLVAEGANEFLPDQDQIDFMVIDDKELIDVIASISPEIDIA